MRQPVGFGHVRDRRRRDQIGFYPDQARSKEIAFDEPFEVVGNKARLTSVSKYLLTHR